jgi:uncharacterized damage-inducible protein DinB
MSDPRYPVGKYVPDDAADAATLARWIEEVAAAPAALRAAVDGLGPAELATPYREGGWTLRQVVHHVPDSHLNAYVRFRLALTEDTPTVKPYDEAAWAELADARTAPPELSLALLESLHGRWVILLRSLGPTDLARAYRHPEHGRTMTLAQTLGLYAWHGRHHTAQITALRAARGW